MACVGDSLTGGYVGPLQEIIKSREPGSQARITRHGIDGMACSDLRQWIQNAGLGVEGGVDIVVLLMGTNDGSSQMTQRWDEQRFVESLTALIREVQKQCQGSPRFLIGVPPPVYPDKMWSHLFDATIINKVLPRLVPSVAANLGFGVVDIFTALGGAGLTRPSLSFDGVHCSPEGYKVMAEAVYEALCRAAVQCNSKQEAPQNAALREPMASAPVAATAQPALPQRLTSWSPSVFPSNVPAPEGTTLQQMPPTLLATASSSAQVQFPAAAVPLEVQRASPWPPSASGPTAPISTEVLSPFAPILQQFFAEAQSTTASASHVVAANASPLTGDASWPTTSFLSSQPPLVQRPAMLPPAATNGLYGPCRHSAQYVR